MVYMPSDDTYLMNEALQLFELKHKKILEMGCGNTSNSIYCAKKDAIVYSLDLDPKALKYGKKHAKREKVEINFIQSDMFTNLEEGDFDFIFFNPPYLVSDKIEDMTIDALEKGRFFIDIFLKNFDKYLAKNGIALLLHTDYNDLERTKEIIINKGFLFEIVARKKLFFEELYIIKIWERP
jgi:release factor glutamine methyltransferase